VATVTVALNRRAAVLDATNLTRQRYAYGSNIANDWRVLAMLSCVFVLMTAVSPLWRLRNLDVLVASSLVLSVVLLDRWMLDRMVLVSYPALAYLAVRCGWWALGTRREPAPSVPLYTRLTRKWTATQQVRILRLVAAALSLVVVMVGLTSLHVLDVGYAVMEGATLILHGVLPYGHIPDVLHGDTYPIGSYLLYVPAAWLSPVRSTWDDADLTLLVAVAAALATAAGLSHLAARPAPRGDRRAAEAELDGLRAAIAWLAFPPLLVTVSTGTTDVVLAAALVGAVLLWRRPGWASALLAGAAWFKLAPAALLPLWLSRLRGRAAVRSVAAVLVVSCAMVVPLIALGGARGVSQMWHAVSFQFTRSSPHTLWSLFGSVPLQQLAQAATVAVIVAAAIRMRADRSLADDRGRIAAIAATVMIGLQISGNYWNYMYLVWLAPLLLLSIIALHPSENVQSETHPSTQRAQPPMYVSNVDGSL
jgi:hypothetical protein